jgi:hypothetical protein
MNNSSNIKLSTQAENTVFTTHRKKPKSTIDICRKGSIVKERCRQLCKVVTDLFPGGFFSDEDLITLIEDYIGADKETIRSYRGYAGHVRAGRCGDNHIVGISRKGYLEKFGFMSKVPGRKWRLTQSTLFESDLREAPITHQACKESVSSGLVAKEKISFSVVGEGVSGEGELLRVKASNNELEEEEARERKRNFSPKIYGELTPLEWSILHAKPLVKVNTPSSDSDGGLEGS